MPAAFDQARVEQETAVQGIEQAKEQKEVAVINANTRVSLAREEAQVIVLEAEANAASLRLEADAQVEALRARFRAEREVRVVRSAARQCRGGLLAADVQCPCGPCHRVTRISRRA